MDTLFLIFFIIVTVFNIYLIFVYIYLRNSMKKAFYDWDSIGSDFLTILHSLSDDPLIESYMISNAPLFLYPSASFIFSKINSFFQLICIGILLFSLYYYNLLYIVLSIIFFYFCGIVGSRFNKSSMFDLTVKKYSRKYSPYDRNYFAGKLKDFHDELFFRFNNLFKE